MKRLFALLLTAVILSGFCGCHTHDPGGVAFYYCRSPEQYQYFEENAVIRSESRDLMGHRQDLQYLAGLYLAGPMAEDLISPFPRTVRLLSVKQDGERILIELTEQDKTMSDSEFSLACTCLAMTCMEFTGCSEITVVSGSRTITLNAGNILLYDSLPQQETDGG